MKTNRTTKLLRSVQPAASHHMRTHTRVVVVIVGQGCICFPQSRRIHLPAVVEGNPPPFSDLRFPPSVRPRPSTCSVWYAVWQRREQLIIRLSFFRARHIKCQLPLLQPLIEVEVRGTSTAAVRVAPAPSFPPSLPLPAAWCI